MKKIISFAFISAALFVLAACSDETETKVLSIPTVTLSSSSVTLSYEAVDSYTINYSVANPASDGATVSASADGSWITVLDTSVSGQVSFSVGENTADEMRTATLTLSYAYKDGTSTAKAAIVQYGFGGPVLSVDPNSIVADVEGGEFSFDYSIDNSIDGESIKCETTEEWLTGLTDDGEGTVTFTVAANEGFEIRTGVITVTYASITKEVSVVQDRVNIEIIVEPNSILANYEGGKYSLTYTGVPDGMAVSAETDVEWITEIDSSVAGTVSFTVAVNPAYITRSDIITLTYDDVSRNVPVVQDHIAEPSLSVSPTSFTVDAKSTSLSFTYTVTNPIETESISFESNVDWISNFTDSGGTVSFTVSENTGENRRTGAITVTYAGKVYDAFVETIIVSQAIEEGFDIVGKYLASGYDCYDGDTTWEMTIHQDAYDPDKYWIDGLTPTDEGFYSRGTFYCAYGYFGDDSKETFVIPSQITDWISSGYYVGWTPCTLYDGDWYYDGDYIDLTFTMKDSSTWESDYGVFLAAFISKDLVAGALYSFFDVVAPTITITKISDDPDAVSNSVSRTSVRTLNNLEVHTGVKPAK